MDTAEATHILNISGAVTSHLHDDFNDFHTKLLQLEEDINRLKATYRRLKEIRAAAGYGEDGPALEDVIFITSEALISLGKTIARLKTKRECLNFCINTGTAASKALNKFGNKIPAISKNN